MRNQSLFIALAIFFSMIMLTGRASAVEPKHESQTSETSVLKNGH